VGRVYGGRVPVFDWESDSAALDRAKNAGEYNLARYNGIHLKSARNIRKRPDFVLDTA
jgi:hypothetical protein